MHLVKMISDHKWNMLKANIILLLVVLIPTSVIARKYSYNKIVTLELGSDNFNLDKTRYLNVNNGCIELTDSLVIINALSYPLKIGRKPGIYKSKRCALEFIYSEKELHVVKVSKFNRVTYYYIDGNTP